MCGRIVIGKHACRYINSKCIQAEYLNVSNISENYNVSPGGNIPCCYLSSGKNGIKTLKIQEMHWGLSSKGSNILIFNSRNDTVGVYGIYKNLKRCVVIVSGYYEWLNKNRPFYFHKNTKKNSEDKKETPLEGKESETPIPSESNEENDILFLAGLYKDIPSESTEENNKEVTIITCDALDDISYIHERMPIILKDYDEAMQYLNGKKLGDIKISMEDISYYEVGDLVNKPTNITEDNILPVEQVKVNKNNNLLIKNFLQPVKKSELEEKLEKVNKETKKEDDKDNITTITGITKDTNRYDTLKKKNNQKGKHKGKSKVKPFTANKKSKSKSKDKNVLPKGQSSILGFIKK